MKRTRPIILRPQWSDKAVAYATIQRFDEQKRNTVDRYVGAELRRDVVTAQLIRRMEEAGLL